MSACAAHELSRENLRLLRRTFVDIQRAANPRRNAISRRRYAEHIRHEREVWGVGLKTISDHIFESLDLDAAIHYAQTSWVQTNRESAAKALWATIFRDSPPPPPDWQSPNTQEVKDKLAAGHNTSAFMQGAVQIYLGMAAQTSEAAGQISLDHMGLNKTWAWAHPQSMANDLFSVRGSKVIQNMYGDHLNALTKIITKATDPRHPQTIQQVKAQIAEQWPGLQKYQVERIARTETATVWSSTSMNAYQANGISSWESSIATGPTIGVESEDPCDECVDMASQVHSMDDDIPPWHPNCRCEIIPSLESEDGTPWLPPDEPFTGGAEGPDMQVCGSEGAILASRDRDRLLKMGARIKKAASCLTPAPEPGDPFGGTTSPMPAEDAIAYYHTPEAFPLNDALRSGKTLTPEQQSVVSALDEALTPAASDSTLYRGVVDRGVLGGLNPGSTFSDGGFMSTSESEYAADDFAFGIASSTDRPVVLRIAAPKGTKMLDIPAGPYGDQAEKLLPRGTTLEVVGSAGKTTEGTDILNVRVVPEKTPLPSLGIPEAKALMTSANNKISGLKTRLKLESKKPGGGDPAKLADIQQRLADQIKTRDDLKAHIKSGGKTPHPVGHEPAQAPAAPVVPPTTEAGLTDGPATEVLDKVYAQWGDGLSVDELKGLDAYRQNEGFVAINKFLREGVGGEKNLKVGDTLHSGVHIPAAESSYSVEQAVGWIDSAMAKAPQATAGLDMTLFRGVRDMNKAFGEGGPKVGFEFVDQGYVSTTTEFDIAAHRYTREMGAPVSASNPNAVVVEVHVPAETRGAWMRANHNLDDMGNREFVLPRGMKFRVSSVEDRPLYGEQIRVAVVEVVPKVAVVKTGLTQAIITNPQSSALYRIQKRLRIL